MQKDSNQNPVYQIRIQGHLDHMWVEWLGGLTITHLAGGVTLLEGTVVDQAALHGLLARIRDLGLPLLLVNQILPDRSSPPKTQEPKGGYES